MEGCFGQDILENRQQLILKIVDGDIRDEGEQEDGGREHGQHKVEGHRRSPGCQSPVADAFHEEFDDVIKGYAIESRQTDFFCLFLDAFGYSADLDDALHYLPDLAVEMMIA